jgi:hypothetical protein
MTLAATIAAAASLAGAGAVQAARPLGSQGARTAPAVLECKRGYYKNVDGRCVHRPVHAASAPAGATAKCRDGSYSFSRHASGTCSHHGGVAVWIHRP